MPDILVQVVLTGGSDGTPWWRLHSRSYEFRRLTEALRTTRRTLRPTCAKKAGHELIETEQKHATDTTTFSRPDAADHWPWKCLASALLVSSFVWLMCLMGGGGPQLMYPPQVVKIDAVVVLINSTPTRGTSMPQFVTGPAQSSLAIVKSGFIAWLSTP